MAKVLANGIEQHVQQMWPPGDPDRPPTVVGIHGIGTDSLASYYFTLAKPLADAGCHVVMYDLRGHGRSGRPPAGYTLDDFVADLAALLDQLGVAGRAYLVGNSFGGTVAMSFAARHPDRVAGIAMIESEPATDAWSVKMAANLAKAQTELARAEALAWITVRYGRHTAKLAKAAATLLRTTTLTRDIPAGPVLSTEEIRSIRCPVLAMYGAESDLAVQAPLLAELLASCTTVLVPGQEHSVLVEQPGEVYGLVLTWLRRNERARMVATPVPGADQR